MNKKLFLYTKAFSDLGNMMNLIIITAVILSLTGSAAWLSAVLVARVLGGVLSGLVAGGLADRLSRKKLMIFSDVARGIVLLVLISFPIPSMFLISAFLMGCLGPFFKVSFGAEVPRIFGENRILETNALISKLTSISMVLGFLGSAFLSNIVDYKIILFIDALSFFLCAFVIYKLNWENNSEEHEPVKSFAFKEVTRDWLEDVSVVKLYLSKHFSITLVFIVMLVLTFAASSHNMGIPMLASNLSVEKATFYQGIIWGTWAVGNVLANFILPKAEWIKRRLELSFLLLVIMMSSSFILLFGNHTFLVLLFIAFMTGMFDGSVLTLSATILQKADNKVRGRIFGVSSLINSFGFATGFIIAPLVLAHVSLGKFVLIFHGCAIVTTVCMLTIKLLVSFSKQKASSFTG